MTTPTENRPTTALVVAMTRKGVIGNQGRLPWQLPEDLARFKQLTGGGSLVMGRTTFESLGRPLPDRANIVISTTLPARQGLTVCPTLMDALAAALRIGKPIFFIGGTAVYQKALEIVDEMHISWVDGEYEGDCWFPPFNRSEWRLVEEEVCEGFTYQHYMRL